MQIIIARILALFGGSVVRKIISCIPALVAKAEVAMADGKITAEERKQFVLDAIDIISGQFGYKITGILRWCIQVIVDAIAKKLPSKDVNIPAVILKVLDQYKG